MEDVWKADRKGKTKPEIIRPADNECKTCDGNIRASYTNMRESEDVEVKFQRNQGEANDCRVGSNRV